MSSDIKIQGFQKLDTFRQGWIIVKKKNENIAKLSYLIMHSLFLKIFIHSHALLSWSKNELVHECTSFLKKVTYESLVCVQCAFVTNLTQKPIMITLVSIELISSHHPCFHLLYFPFFSFLLSIALFNFSPSFWLRGHPKVMHRPEGGGVQRFCYISLHIFWGGRGYFMK